MRKKIVWVLLSAAAFLLAAAGGIAGCRERDPVVLYVGGMPVRESEFLMIYQYECRAGLLNRSLAEGGGSGGAFPEEAREQALEETCSRLLAYKGEQKLFEEYGVCRWDYDRFLEEWAEQQDAKEPGYGKQSYDKYDYYVYQQSRYRLEVIEALGKAEADTQELYQYYLSQGESLRQQDSWVLDCYRVSQGEPAEREEFIRQIRLDPQTVKYEQELVSALDGHWEELSREGASLRLETENGTILLRVAEYEKGEIPEFSQCRQLIEKRYYEEAYSRLAEEAKNNLEVEKTRAYEKIEFF